MSERGEYRGITRVLLDGRDFQRLPERANHLFLILKINFGPAGIDVWYPEELVTRLTRQSGVPAEGVREALAVLEREEWIKREENVVWIVRQLEFDPHSRRSNQNHRLGVQRHIAGLPHLELVREFCRAYSEWFPSADPIPEGMRWALEPSPRPRKRYPKGIGMVSESHPDGISITSPNPRANPSPNISGAEAPANWVESARVVLLAIGTFTHGRIGKALSPVVQQYGWPDTERGLRDYVAAPKNGRNRTPEYFAQESGTWVVGAREGMSDADGVPTARADRLLGVAS